MVCTFSTNCSNANGHQFCNWKSKLEQFLLKEIWFRAYSACVDVVWNASEHIKRTRMVEKAKKQKKIVRWHQTDKPRLNGATMCSTVVAEIHSVLPTMSIRIFDWEIWSLMSCFWDQASSHLFAQNIIDLILVWYCIEVFISSSFGLNHLANFLYFLSM